MVIYRKSANGCHSLGMHEDNSAYAVEMKIAEEGISSDRIRNGTLIMLYTIILRAKRQYYQARPWSARKPYGQLVCKNGLSWVSNL